MTLVVKVKFGKTSKSLKILWKWLWKKCIIWTSYFYYFSFYGRQNCQDEDSNTTLRKLTSLKKNGFPITLHWPTYSQEKWRWNPVLPTRFILPKKINNYHSSLALETGNFSPGDTTNLLWWSHIMINCNIRQ